MKRPLRIAIDIRHIRDFGIGSHIRNLILALARRDADHQYILAGRTQDLSTLSALPARFQRAQFPRSDHGVYNQVAFPWFLRQFKPDLVHIPLNSVPLLLPKPFVVTVHDMSSLLFQDDRGQTTSPLREQYRLFRFRQGLERASRIIAVSQATQGDVESLLGISPDRICQIYGAVDPKYITPPHGGLARAAAPDLAEHYRRQFLERYQVHYPYLLYAGTIRPRKNLPRLIEAFAVLRSELQNHPVYRDVKLLVIGDEVSKHPEVRRAVVHAHLEGAVRFFGFVSFDALRMFYQGAAAFVFPSLYEGFGLPPLEAMASGTAVVTSNVSSLPEVVGDAAELVSPDNVFDIVRGIREVLLKPGYREELIARGFKQVRRFDWDDTAQQILAVYEQASRT
jgi:glycosyltransferase involved in cell wall biosynthesis